MSKRREQNSMDFGVRVAVVVERGDSLLLVRHKKPDREPYWVLPGGRLEPGETVPECAKREMREETGLDARFSRILYVGELLREGRHTVDITVEATIEGSEEAALGYDPEVSEGEEPTLKGLAWVGRGRLEGVDLLPKSLKERLMYMEPSKSVYLGEARD